MTTILGSALLRQCSFSRAPHPLLNQFARSMTSFELVKVSSPVDHVKHVQLNRPKKLNAMNQHLWREIGECFDEISLDKSCRAVVLSGEGKGFSAGIDFMDFLGVLQSAESDDIARKTNVMYKLVRGMQDRFTALERCSKPVICAVHGPCIGAGINLITAADIRLCSKDAYFNVKEVAMGLAADVGALQRLPRIVGNQSFVREICMTARNVDAEEARREGIVSGTVYEDKDSLLEGALALASTIARFSPVAVQGTKYYLNRALDGHRIEDDLESMARWNGTMLQSEDVSKSVMAAMSKQEEPTDFEKF